MEQVAVTYRGPSGTYSIEHDGDWFEFDAGRSLTVPDALAEHLLDVSGHTFELDDEIGTDEGFVKDALDTGNGSGGLTGSTQP